MGELKIEVIPPYPIMRDYAHAPIRFIGQKRNWKSYLKKVDFNNRVAVDVFGGSGFISHTIKANNPSARVVWNDFDGYYDRFKLLDATERLRAELVRRLAPTKPKIKEKLTDEQKAIIDATLSEFEGYDQELVFSWFSHQLAVMRGEASRKYYNLRESPIPKFPDYLAGVERVKDDFREVIKHFNGLSNVVFICDPPYIFTHQATYGKKADAKESKDFHSSFSLGDYVEMIKLIGDNPAYIFSSEKSETKVVLELLNISYQVIEKDNCIGSDRGYVEILFFINSAKKSREIPSLFGEIL
ncbi:MAG: hypothetical protein LBO72_08650 [Helicobacteraceae bacterium]|jgi:site-specific DNA-adenine methylase|nr:hypothetical protein [Helicobacteraceae bacterium]